jgi:hypothetical protein
MIGALALIGFVLVLGAFVYVLADQGPAAIMDVWRVVRARGERRSRARFVVMHQAVRRAIIEAELVRYCTIQKRRRMLEEFRAP